MKRKKYRPEFKREAIELVLLDEGETVSLNRVARLMAAERVQGWPRRKKRGFGRVASGRPVGVKTCWSAISLRRNRSASGSRTSRK